MWLDPEEVRPDVEYLISILPTLTSWDGFALAEARSFRVRFAEDRAPVGGGGVPDFARDVLPLLRRSCAVMGCHASMGPALGLDLSSVEGVARSAVGIASVEWPSVSGDIDRGNVQWAGLQRIAPGAPGESYLVYKLLGVGPVRGARMPRGAAAWSSQDVQLVSDWIAAGALLR